MASFPLEGKFSTLKNITNTLCNTLDITVILAKEESYGHNHEVNIAIGKVSKAFLLISEAGSLLKEAATVLDSYKELASKLEERSKEEIKNPQRT